MEIGPLDRVVPAPRDRVRDGTRITVTRVTEQFVSQTKPVAFDTVKTFTTSLRPGHVRQIRQGIQGKQLFHYRVRCQDGVPISSTRISSILVRRPVSRVVEIGSRGRYTSRGAWRTLRVFTMSASAYDPGPRSCGRYATGRTACGLRAGYGVVAVDPRVVRLGSRLYVEGYGYAVAGDKGSAIKGSRIDLGFNTYYEAMRFGRKKVTVHLLQE
jgi:3D (Asp-Asp-Asp) domain-containing protein